MGEAELVGQLDARQAQQPDGSVEIPQAGIQQACPLRQRSTAGLASPTVPDTLCSCHAPSISPRGLAWNPVIRYPVGVTACASAAGRQLAAGRWRTAAPYTASSIRLPLSVRITSCPPFTATMGALALQRPVRAARRNVRPFGSRPRTSALGGGSPRRTRRDETLAQRWQASPRGCDGHEMAAGGSQRGHRSGDPRACLGDPAAPAAQGSHVSHPPAPTDGRRVASCRPCI